MCVTQHSAVTTGRPQVTLWAEIGSKKLPGRLALELNFITQRAQKQGLRLTGILAMLAAQLGRTANMNIHLWCWEEKPCWPWWSFNFSPYRVLQEWIQRNMCNVHFCKPQLKLRVSLGSVLNFQRCAYALVRFRYKTHLVRLEKDPVLTRNTCFVATNMAGFVPRSKKYSYQEMLKHWLDLWSWLHHHPLTLMMSKLSHWHVMWPR